MPYEVWGGAPSGFGMPGGDQAGAGEAGGAGAAARGHGAGAGMPVPAVVSGADAGAPGSAVEAVHLTDLPAWRAGEAADEAAPAGPRLLARVIDGVLAAVVAALLSLPLILAASHHADAILDERRRHLVAGTSERVVLFDGTLAALYVGIFCVLLVVLAVVEGVQVARSGQTVGKRLLGLRVVRDTSGRPPGFGAGAGRAAVMCLMVLVPPVLVADAVWCLVDHPGRQCLHDKAARTRVVRG